MRGIGKERDDYNSATLLQTTTPSDHDYYEKPMTIAKYLQLRLVHAPYYDITISHDLSNVYHVFFWKPNE